MEVLQDVIFGVGTTIKQCQNVSMSNNIDLYIGRDSGDVDPALTAVMKAEPRATIASMDIPGLISTFGVTAGATVTAGTVSLPFQKRADGSTFAGILSHFTVTGANAYGFVSQFSATQDGNATGTAEIGFKSTTGLASPLTSATGQTLSASTYDSAYTLGPAKIDGTQVPEITGITVTTGLTVEAKYFDGSAFPKKYAITSRDPVIELTVADFDSIDTYGPLSITNNSQDVVAYFRKLSDGSTRVADATAEHVAFTLSNGIITVEEYSAQDQSDGSATIKITGKALAASSTSAISL